LRGYNGIADTGFILQANENKSFGGTGPLSTNHLTAYPNPAAIRRLREIAAAPNITGQHRSQITNWMRTNG
jgi:hypothetical protein